MTVLELFKQSHGDETFSMRSKYSEAQWTNYRWVVKQLTPGVRKPHVAYRGTDDETAYKVWLAFQPGQTQGRRD